MFRKSSEDQSSGKFHPLIVRVSGQRALSCVCDVYDQDESALLQSPHYWLLVLATIVTSQQSVSSEGLLVKQKTHQVLPSYTKWCELINSQSPPWTKWGWCCSWLGPAWLADWPTSCPDCLHTVVATLGLLAMSVLYGPDIGGTVRPRHTDTSITLLVLLVLLVPLNI